MALNQFHRVPFSVCCRAVDQRLIVDAKSYERGDVKDSSALLWQLHEGDTLTKKAVLLNGICAVTCFKLSQKTQK